MKFSKRLGIIGIFLCLLFTMPLGVSAAEGDYPSKPIVIVCGYSPGGSTDRQIRAVAPYFQKHLNNQSVIIENLPGASGVLASNKVFTSKPDGYMILVSCLQQLVLSENLYKDVSKYDTRKISFIHNLVKENPILVTHPDLYSTFEEFIQTAKTKKLKVAIPGIGQFTHLMVVLIEKLAQVEFNIVPFEGGGAALSSVMGKHIDGLMTNGSTVFSLVQSGDLRPLIVMAEERTSQFPKIPVPSDFGYDIKSNQIILYTTGIYGPPGMPPERIKILEQAFSKALKETEYLETVGKMNVEVLPLGSEVFRKLYLREYPVIVDFMKILK